MLSAHERTQFDVKILKLKIHSSFSAFCLEASASEVFCGKDLFVEIPLTTVFQHSASCHVWLNCFVEDLCVASVLPFLSLKSKAIDAFCDKPDWKRHGAALYSGVVVAADLQSCQPLCFGHSLLHPRALHYAHDHITTLSPWKTFF